MKVGKGVAIFVILVLILTAVVVSCIVNSETTSIGMGILAAVLFSLAGAGLIALVTGSGADVTLKLLETETNAKQQ